MNKQQKVALYAAYHSAKDILDLVESDHHLLSDGPGAKRIQHTSLEVAKQCAEVILLALSDVTSDEVEDYGKIQF